MASLYTLLSLWYDAMEDLIHDLPVSGQTLHHKAIKMVICTFPWKEFYIMQMLLVIV